MKVALNFHNPIVWVYSNPFTRPHLLVMTYHWVFNRNITIDATGGAGTDYPS